MATKAEFTEQEWATLQKGVTGAGMLVSVSDPGFMDTFGEASTMSKHLAGQHLGNTSELVRAIAEIHGTGFGLTGSPERLRDETIDALRSSVALLAVKAPEEVEPYRQLVLGVAQAVAEAKTGIKPGEEAAIGSIREALGAA